jgi:HPt (histidine-containing phosphotransfer) domain-containing protein
MKGDRERCLAAGMDGYIAKPIRAKDLYALVEGMVADAGRSPPAGRPRTDEEEAVNRNQVLEQIGGSIETLRDLAQLFAVECPRLMGEMRDAIVRNAPAELQRAAHTLKGSIQIFGVKRPAAAVLRLEAMGRDGNLTDVEEAWSVLAKEIEWLLPQVADLARG